jgi:hypothetical protein
MSKSSIIIESVDDFRVSLSFKAFKLGDIETWTANGVRKKLDESVE